MYTHLPDRANVVRISQDGHRAVEESSVVNRNASATPGYFQEDMVRNAVMEGADFSYDMGDTSLPAEEEVGESDGISVRMKSK
jgi:hypothetical protein